MDKEIPGSPRWTLLGEVGGFDMFGPFLIFPEILGMSSSQLTNSYFFRGVASSTTKQLAKLVDHWDGNKTT